MTATANHVLSLRSLGVSSHTSKRTPAMNRFALALFAYSASALLAFAQNTPPINPPELATIREEHLRSMQRVAIPVLSAYARQLESQKSVFTRQGKLNAALAVDNELKEVTQQLQAANAASARTGATMQLTILSASYGSPAKKRVADITKNIRKALEAGTPTIKLTTADGAAGVDPAPFTLKETTITYTINGQRKQKTFPEGHKLNFKEELN